MSQIKELLEKALDCAKDKNIKRLDSIDAGQTYKWIMQDMFALVDQALAKLSTEQPPDSDFTKKMREEHKEVYIHRPCQYTTDIYDLCAIIDRSKASRKELLTELEKTNQCFKCKFGYRTTEITCPGYADAELPCAGFEEHYDGNVAIEAAIIKAQGD